NASPMVALIVGALVAAITQSFIAIAIMAVSLVGTGALGAPQAMMVIYGANFGVGFFRRLMTASMTGEAKQLFIYQNFFRYLGTGGSVLLFYAVPVHGKPVMLYLAELVTADVGTQLALIFLACNLPAVLIGSLFDERLLKLLVKLSPPTIEDELSRLKYLATASADDPAVAIGQLEAELAARVGKLPDYIESLRDEKPTQATPEILQESGQRIGTEMSSFAHELMSQRLTVEERGHLSLVVNELTLVRMLEDSLYDAACLVRDGLGESREAFGGRAWVILEALHSQLVTLGEAIDSGDVECLERITTDKGRVLDEFRRTCLESATTTPPAAQETFSKLISHFEYVVWTIHRLANLLRRVRAYHSGRTGA
ncbi:MAG: hypothetical protein HY815_06830, partial [Candidatus Riflebacteria bacterium]|nr:hypothetical protein [Candidatus Riflebacteria bacterium]